MNKVPIRVLRQENYNVNRYHNTWFENFLSYLSRDFDVEYVNTTEAQVYIQDKLYGDQISYPISDVDMILENTLNGEICCISFTECFNSYVVHYMKNPRFKSMILAHFNYHHLYYWTKRDNVENKLNRIKPWIFPVYNDFDVDYYRTVRDESELTDNLFFKGSGLKDYRIAVKYLCDQHIINPSVHSLDDYLLIMSRSKIALGYYQDLDRYVTPFDYPGEFCYRDMEYISVGVPFIRIEYRDSIFDGLYPNHHYISINRETAYSVYERNGNEGIANLIRDKYEEVKDDKFLLEFISKNQREYYDKYVRWPNSAKLAYKQLGLNDWLK